MRSRMPQRRRPALALARVTLSLPRRPRARLVFRQVSVQIAGLFVGRARAAATPSAAAADWPCQHVSASGSVTVARRHTIGIDVLESIHTGASRARGSGCAAWSSRAPQAFLWDGHLAAACQGLHEIGFPPAARDAALPTQSPSCLRAWSSGNVRPRVLVAVLVGHECLVEQGPRGLDDATVEQVMRDSVPTTARSARIG